MGRRTLPLGWTTPRIVTSYLQWVIDGGAEEGTTIRTYEGILNRLALWLQTHHELALEDAQDTELREWRSSLTQQRASVILYVRAVKAFYRWAAGTGRVPADPAWNIRVPRGRRGRPRPIGEQTLVVAIQNAPDRIRPWLVLAACAGLRACEIARLRRDDIYDTDPEPHMIIWGKGGRHRTVPLSPQVWDALLAAGLPARGPIFRRGDGRPNLPNGITSLTNSYLHGLGIDETLHQVRHRFGSRGWQAVPDIRLLQEVMGHSRLDTTALYTQPDMTKAGALVNGVQINL